MAANLSGPPDRKSSQCHEISIKAPTTSDHHHAPPSKIGGTPASSQNRNCSCSNIQIMQLFHEMKQEYPTVPDDMVSQLVTENCHDRLKCKEILAEREEEYAQTAQAFPSQSIRYNKPPTPPRRCKNIHRQQQQQLQNAQQKYPKREPETTNDEVSSETNKPEVTKLPSRPNFLALRKNTPEISPITFTRRAPTPPRPIRIAPPPPSSSSSSTPTPPPISATAAITSDPNTPITTNGPTEPLNVSLNVTVSPVPQRRPRHTSELNVQPEMPYHSADAAGGPRSFTSVNFTLRPPSEENAQAPIEICAGPSLTYSSSSYDARQGYQSSLKITVGGVSGIPTAFSSMRTRARSHEVTDDTSSPVLAVTQQQQQQQQQPKIPHAIARQNQIAILNGNSNSNNAIMPVPTMRPGISLPNVFSDSKGIVSPLREDEVVRRQLDRKRGLDNELQRDKHRLENMEYDILILKANFTTSDLERLIEEIKLLQRECDYMTELLDKAGVPALGDTSMNVIGHGMGYNHQRSLTPSRSTTKPPRPPLPAALRTTASPQRPTQAPALSYSPSFFGNSASAESELPWTCSACTFQNHPLLNQCEQCEVPQHASGMVNSQQHHQQQYGVQYQRVASSPSVVNGGVTPATPYSPALYPTNPQYAPDFPYSGNTHHLHPELLPINNETLNAQNINNSQSVGDLPAAFRAVFKKGHRHTPSM